MIQHKISARREDHYTVTCDTCGAATPQNNFETAGDAADHARSAGFTTRFTSLIAPATWQCLKHSPKKEEAQA